MLKRGILDLQGKFQLQQEYISSIEEDNMNLHLKIQKLKYDKFTTKMDLNEFSPSPVVQERSGGFNQTLQRLDELSEIREVTEEMRTQSQNNPDF